MSSKPFAGPKKGLSLERLWSFLDVHDAGGIALAAPRTPARQSQLSRQISELEASLGYALFVRAPQRTVDHAGRGFAPTPEGAALARVVRALRQGLEDVAATSTWSPVTCTLGAGDSAIQWLVLPQTPALLAQGARLDVQALGSEEISRGLLDGQLDLGILRAPESAPDLKSVRIGRVEYALFVARHLVRGRAPSCEEVLKRAPLAVLTGEPALTRALAQLGPSSVVCETFPQVAQAVRQGRCVGVLPTFARAELAAEHFVAVNAPQLEPCAAPLLLAWHRRLDERRPALAAVRKGLAAALRRCLISG